MRLIGLHLYPVKAMRGIEVGSAAVEPCGLAWDRRWMVVGADGRFLTQRQLPAMARFDATLSDAGPTFGPMPTLTLSLDGERIDIPAQPRADARHVEVTVWRSTVPAIAADPRADHWLSAHLAQPCRLVFLADTQARPIEAPFAQFGETVSFADGFPVLLTSTGSLAALNDALDASCGQVIGMDRFRPNLVVDGPGAWTENGWRQLRIGEVRFRAARPCVRCAVPGIDQRRGDVPRPGEPLRTLRRLNRQPEGIVFGSNLIPLGRGRLNLGDEVEILEQDPA